MCISAVNCPDSVYHQPLSPPSRRTSRSYYLRNVDQGVPSFFFIPSETGDVNNKNTLKRFGASREKLYVKTRNYLCKEEEGMLLLIMPGYKRLTLTENKIKLLETYLTVIKNNPDEIVNMYFPSSVFSVRWHHLFRSILPSSSFHLLIGHHSYHLL